MHRDGAKLTGTHGVFHGLAVPLSSSVTERHYSVISIDELHALITDKNIKVKARTKIAHIHALEEFEKCTEQTKEWSDDKSHRSDSTLIEPSNESSSDPSNHDDYLARVEGMNMTQLRAEVGHCGLDVKAWDKKTLQDALVGHNQQSSVERVSPMESNDIGINDPTNQKNEGQLSDTPTSDTTVIPTSDTKVISSNSGGIISRA